jgi:predicted DNA-binding protein with PD1-like motif
METCAVRLHPHQDLKESLDTFARVHNIEAACVLTCVGSLRRAVLRYANQEQATVLDGKFEIVSLTGTLSKYGSHYHISLSDGEGRTVGAHLLEGCLIYTTAEIVLGVLPGVSFLREMDRATGYEELYIRTNNDTYGGF